MISPVSHLKLKHHFLLSLLCFLAACQTLPDAPVDSSSEAGWQRDIDSFMRAHEAAYQSYDSLPVWRYSAKVGISTPVAREQANLVWQFADQSNQVRLFGPLGVGAIKIEFDQYGVVLSDNRSVLHRGDSAEELVTKIVGWPIPIDALVYWMFALPLPDKAFEYQQDDAGNLSKLRQLGWSIEYSSYKQYSLGARQTSVGESSIGPVAESQIGFLPRKIVATKTDQNGGLIVVKLITKGWQ